MWEPAETVPIGIIVLIAIPDASGQRFMVRLGMRGVRQWHVLGMIEHDEPVYWHPLPDLPEPPPMGLKTRTRIETERRDAERD